MSLQETRSFGGGLSVGKVKPVDLLSAETGTPDDTDKKNAENYKNNLTKLNESLKPPEGEPQRGGSLRVVAASSRSISLDETFKKPLVIGYLGFDLQIRKVGSSTLLGPPIATHAVLKEQRQPEGTDANYGADEAAYVRALRRCERAHSEEVYKAVLGRLGPEAETAFALNVQDKDQHVRFKKSLREWRGDDKLKIAVATRVVEQELAKDADGGR